MNAINQLRKRQTKCTRYILSAIAILVATVNSKGKKLLLTTILFLFSVFTFAVTNTMTAGTTWEGGTWSQSHVPLSTEDVIINSGLIVTINSAAVCASLTVAATGQLTITAANSLTISGSLQNNGTFTAGANTTLTFNGASNSTVTGSGIFTINYMVLNMSAKTTVLDIQSSNFITGINAAAGYNFTFTRGIFKYNNTATLNDCHDNGSATALTIPFNVIIESDQGTLNLCPNGGNGSVVLSGKLYINGGIVNIQNNQALNAGNDFVYHANGGTPQLYVTTGTLSVGGGFHAQGGTDYIDFNMSGGNATFADNGMSVSYTFQLANVTGGSTTMTAGTIVLQDACNANLPDIDMGGANVAPYSVTAGTVQFGNLSTQGGATYFGIQPNGAHNYPNLDFEGGTAKSVEPWGGGDLSVISIYICPAMTFDVSGTNPNVTFIGTNGTFALNNSGTLVIGTGTYTFQSAISQLVTGTVTNTFVNVVINNAAGVTFQIPTTITGTLTLTNGKLTTTSANLLTMNAGSLATSGSASSFVDGPIAKAGTTAFVFPTGNGTTWAPIAIGVPSASETFTAQYFHTGYGTYTISATTPSPLNNVSNIEYWTLGRAGGQTAKVTLYSENAATSMITSCSDLRIVHWNGSAWENNNDAVTTTFGACGVPINPTTQSGNIVTNAAVTSFSPFTFGSKNGTNPLPIELLSFDAVCNSDKVNLNWATASETNNDFFTVQRSKDGISFEEALRIKGVGNSNTVLNYSAIDYNPYEGTSYYRLKQTDYNGNSALFNISSVDCSTGSVASVTIYPNPFNTQATIVISDASQFNHYQLEIYNVLGTEVMSTIITDQSTVISNLPTGVYLYKVIYNGKIIQSGQLISQQ
jgi:hypothetical protein